MKTHIRPVIKIYTNKGGIGIWVGKVFRHWPR